MSLPRLPALTRENERLRTELVQSHLEAAQLRETLRKAQQAEALSAVQPHAQGRMVGVLTRSMSPTQQTVLLDGGTQDGVALESTIIDASGVVGRIVEVHPMTALAMLISDPNSRIAAMVERSRETALLVGRGLGFCELIYLEADADVEAGDRVITAGLGGPLPKGLLLGTVGRIARDEQTGSATATMIPASRLGRLEEVLCLDPERTR